MRQLFMKLTALSIALVACTAQPTPSISPSNPQITRTPTPEFSPPISPTPTQTEQDSQPAIVDTPLSATPLQPAPATPSIPQVIDRSNAVSITQTKKIELSPWELIHALDWSADGEKLGVAAGGTISIYSGEHLVKLLTLNPGVWTPGIDFSPDGRLIAAGGRDGFLRIWDAHTGDLLMEFEAHKKGVNSVVFSPDGQHLASGGNDAMARLWDVSTGEERGRMIGGSYSIPAIAYTVDGKSLALANGDIIRLRDVTNQRFVNTLRGGNAFFSLSLSPEGSTAAAGDTTGALFIWELSSESTSHKITTQPGVEESVSTLVWEVAFTPDGSLIASADGSGSINVWDVKTGELLTSIPAHKLAVSAISFSPDGRTLASGGLDGAIYIWGASP